MGSSGLRIPQDCALESHSRKGELLEGKVVSGLEWNLACVCEGTDDKGTLETLYPPSEPVSRPAAHVCGVLTPANAGLPDGGEA
jgi:hypothetical protein